MRYLWLFLHLYEKEGPAGLSRLDGMFALAIMDARTRDVQHIQNNNQYLFFASELKAFDNFTEHVIEFPPGHIFNINEGYYPYYKIPKACRKDLTWEDAFSGIRLRMIKAVVKRLMADVPIGSF